MIWTEVSHKWCVWFVEALCVARCVAGQDPHLGADPPSGRHAAAGVHHASAQPALPAVRVHLPPAARLLQPGHPEGPARPVRSV